jgi:glutathione S-transferase
MPSQVTLYHSPNSRSTTALVMFEELGVDYDLQVLDRQAGDTHTPAFLAINPMGKVPVVVHEGQVVTEQAAIYIYLADLYPEAGLAPAIGDPLRGPYLRWMIFYNASFEPACIDRALKREGGPKAMLPYGDTDQTFKTVLDQLARGDWILGDRFTAADVLWGMALSWMVAFKIFPESPVIAAYLARVEARPATIRARAKDQQLAAALLSAAAKDQA